MLQFIEYPKCSTCRKAKAELNQLGVDFEAVDIVQNTPSRDQLLDWIQNSDFEIKAFFNTSGLKYRELGLKEKVPHMTAREAADLLATDGMLIKRPLLVRDNQILQIGYRMAYEELGL
ncbi:arsenate reductase family protein [Streptococcus gordonii]|jgi:transcriptional regulator, spx/mgsR family|uniref:Arsenate reductase family protein n=1 Tax=Streptococcus gordonii TaxID=1302 RepID=A0AB35FUR0_STRGN|nr:arsenate reductase family protein [Streptococcus gordonii]MBW7664032.1 arsenate reductase family protein [Streptococcus gordonii]MBZ2128169.1 arsenate reductase family protein [Streptococcus gordonii]MBZ2129786.1 arsenate reductase family protein [Streptococcus gordonii]MBZ2131577.1 arsenate reductase family protein [Streptococcus gordonii]RSJ40147.1 Regulatory protein MgsR [Streptococcus gordonii]